MVNKTFLEQSTEYQFAESNFSEILLDLADEGFDWSHLGTDNYDSSLELYDVPNDSRLNEKQQKFIYDNDFSTCYVNHKNGIETHYNWSRPFKVSKGWRRERTEEGFNVSYWPESWNTCKEWSKSGYIKVKENL
jgi:hypothetical protein